MRALGFLLALTAAGCLRPTWYHCDSNAQCGDGVCEPQGYCAFPDPNCGFRFGNQAGPLSNLCVDSVADAGVDSSTDATDATPSCPADFANLTGAPANRFYKRIATTADYATQRAACSGMGSNVVLGFPTAMTELTAMDTLAAGTDYWIGIDDLAAAGTWTTAHNMTATFLPWQGGNPSGNPNDNCVEVLTASATFLNTRCSMTFTAICECE